MMSYLPIDAGVEAHRTTASSPGDDTPESAIGRTREPSIGRGEWSVAAMFCVSVRASLTVTREIP
jgi:hypothetical protein